MSKARHDVVMYLSDTAMSAMADAGVEDLLPSEVLSACFTTCKRTVEQVLLHSSPDTIQYNKHEILDALSEIMKIVDPVIH